MNQPITFSAEIHQHQDINAAFVHFPFDTFELFGEKGQVKVKVLFDNKNGIPGSLTKMKSDCHLLGLTQEIRKELGKTFGDTIDIKLWEDKEERVVIVSDEVRILYCSIRTNKLRNCTKKNVLHTQERIYPLD